MSDDSFDQSESWNMATAYLMRVDSLLTFCNYYHTAHDIPSWYKTLICLHKELYPKLKKPEQDKAENIIKDLTKLKNDAKNRKLVSHQKFIEFELFLRQMIEDRKMFTPRSSDAEKALR